MLADPAPIAMQIDWKLIRENKNKLLEWECQNPWKPERAQGRQGRELQLKLSLLRVQIEINTDKVVWSAGKNTVNIARAQK